MIPTESKMVNKEKARIWSFEYKQKLCRGLDYEEKLNISQPNENMNAHLSQSCLTRSLDFSLVSNTQQD